MATLTKTQLEHAKNKVQSLVAQRLNLFISTLGPRPDVPDYTEAEKLAFIRESKATLNDGRPYGYVWNSFSYPQTDAMATAQRAHDAWESAMSAERAKIEAIQENVIDELVMSPDGMAALTKIATAFA